MKLIKQFMLNRPADKRMAYFYGVVATDEQVWLLRNEEDDLLVLEGDEQYSFVLPVWPSRSFAEMESTHLEDPYEAFNMPLSKFIEELLIDVENDGGAAAIFPNQKDASIQTREEIIEMIRNI